MGKEKPVLYHRVGKIHILIRTAMKLLQVFGFEV
jgi:hypothetical protein